MKKLLLTCFALLASVLLFAQPAMASEFYAAGSTGVDVSYPNCSQTIPKVSFGIVGVNGGLVYSDNPCLAAQASKFTNLSLYVNTGLNASQSSPYYLKAQEGCNGDVYCAAYNYGYAAGQYALEVARSQGVSSSKWWLDVETMNTWDSDAMQNRQSLQGTYDAIKSSGAPLIGAYSTTYQWNTITGSWKNNWPNWGATTWTTVRQAKKYCSGHEFTGGPTLLIQYKSKRSALSQDVAC